LDRCGSVPASGLELASGKGFALLTPLLASERVARKNFMAITARPGWCSAFRFASVESPSERRSTAAVTMATRLSMEAPRFSEGRLQPSPPRLRPVRNSWLGQHSKDMFVGLAAGWRNPQDCDDRKNDKSEQDFNNSIALQESDRARAKLRVIGAD
jgi:hypothetical protein